jgi:hypothetical protein
MYSVDSVKQMDLLFIPIYVTCCTSQFGSQGTPHYRVCYPASLSSPMGVGEFLEVVDLNHMVLWRAFVKIYGITRELTTLVKACSSKIK